MDITQLRNQYAQKMTEAKALVVSAGDNMPKEVSEKIDKILGDADVIKANIELLNKMAAGDAFLNEPAGTNAAHLGWREAGPDEGNPPVDGKAYRQIEVNGKTIRFYVPLSVQAKGYQGAFEGYLRKGFADLGPQDRKTLTEGTDSAGGFLVPEDFQTEVIKKIAAASVVRPSARVQQTSRDMVTWPKINWTTDDIYTSGVRLTWTGEVPASAATHRVTEPVFGQATIPVHTCMASLPLGNDLVEDDAGDLMGLSTDLLSEAFTIGEDNCFINGTGAGQPIGILAQVGVTTAGPASVITGVESAPYMLWGNLLNLEAALPSQYERGARWFARKSTYNYLRQVVSTTSGDPMWPVLAQFGGLGPAPANLLGYPIVKSELVPTIATHDDYGIIFGDLSGYVVLDRVGFSIQALRELYAETNLTLLLARKRVGGQLIEPWKVKVSKTST